MASFAVSGARLGVVRPGVSARSGGERTSAVDLPSVLFRRKNAFSRTVLSCAGAPGKVLVVEEKAYSSAAQATSAAAEASSAVEAEKPEPSQVIEGTDETDDIDGAGMTAKAPLVEEKPRVIAPPGDGQRIHEIDPNPMLEGFWCHLDYR